VVPPGIEKTPDQAARISQSVDFALFRDILAFFDPPHFLTHFSLFHFVDFDHFVFFTFSGFDDFIILVKSDIF